MNQDTIGYQRYMDDFVKYKLAVNKTFIGKVSRGFDFLGGRFDSQGAAGIAWGKLAERGLLHLTSA